MRIYFKMSYICTSPNGGLIMGLILGVFCITAVIGGCFIGIQIERLKQIKDKIKNKTVAP